VRNLKITESILHILIIRAEWESRSPSVWISLHLAAGMEDPWQQETVPSVDGGRETAKGNEF
jgi:hypothetical protein